MKTLKFLPVLFLAIFLISTTYAFGAIYGEWNDGSQSMTITAGDSASFTYDFFSSSAPMNINMDFYDSQYNLVYSVPVDSDEISPCTQDGKPILGTACFSGEAEVESVVTDNSGNYELVMSYSDTTGDTESYSLYLTVKPNLDTNAPIITLLGTQLTYVEKGTSYVDAGATAYDVEDGDLTSQIVVSGLSTVDVNSVGDYLIFYDVKDSAGNQAERVQRTVKVVDTITDTTAPVITVLSPLATTYSTSDLTFIASTDEIATVTFSLDGSIYQPMNSIDGYMNIRDATVLEGAHTLVFKAVDGAGNTATESVDFAVDLGNTAPTITVITPKDNKKYDKSDLTFEIRVDEFLKVTFILDDDSEVSMNYTGILSGVLTFEYDVTSLSDGNHEVTFYARDAADNVAEKTIEFSVDTNADNSNNPGTTVDLGQNDFQEQQYLNQFENPKIIYIGDDEPQKPELNWWQRFVEWLKRIFGFN